MLLYRVENSLQHGPYKSNNFFGAEGYHTGDYWPSPFEERLDYNDTHRCAFLSMEQFYDWFSPWARTVLAQQGFKLITLEVPDYLVQIGKKQVVYKMFQAQRISAMEIPQDGNNPFDPYQHRTRYEQGQVSEDIRRLGSSYYSSVGDYK